MARAAPAPPNWGARAAALRQRYALIWASTFAVVLSYFGSLVVVRAIDDGGVDCRDTCRDAPDNETGTVLLIGDSILKGDYPIVESILDPGAKCMEDGTVRRGVLAKLVYGRFGSGNGYCGTSYGVNFCLDRYLATTKNNVSVIHFAWGAAAAPPRAAPGDPPSAGLHDICENIDSPVSFDEYEANMEAMYRKLRGALAPNGTMIFGTTTPVPPSYDSNKRVNADVLELNVRARALRPGGQNNGVHFSPAGQRLNAVDVAWWIAPFAGAPADAGERAPEIEKHNGEYRLEHWKVALVAQAFLLSALGLVATCVVYGAAAARRAHGRHDAPRPGPEDDGRALDRAGDTGCVTTPPAGGGVVVCCCGRA
ncbi:DUF2263-containing protein [Aureococcus anophagefferens]|nr:DUF2263-containing protein [Aureococcus anophagefferens]